MFKGQVTLKTLRTFGLSSFTVYVLWVQAGGYKKMSPILADQKQGVAGSQPMSTAVHLEPY
jgi:hypothetical protein